MSENYFDCLVVGAQEEVRQLALDLGWSLDQAARQYLQTASSMAAIRSVERMKQPPPELKLVRGTPPKKGLDSG